MGNFPQVRIVALDSELYYHIQMTLITRSEQTTFVSGISGHQGFTLYCYGPRRHVPTYDNMYIVRGG